MPQLNGTIKINGVILQDYMVVSVGDNSLDRQFGLKTSIERESGTNDVPLFIKRTKESQSIEIQLCKYDTTTDSPSPITDIQLRELSRVLFAKEKVSIVECGGVVYYGHFLDGSSWRNGALQGYITLNFELASPYSYSPIIENKYMVTTSKTLQIINESTGTEYTYLDIDFELLGDSDSLTIQNLTNGKSLALEGLTVLEKATIYGQEREIVSNIESTRNLFKLASGSWDTLKLAYGVNRFLVTVVSGEVTFIHQNELALF